MKKRFTCITCKRDRSAYYFTRAAQTGDKPCVCKSCNDPVFEINRRRTLDSFKKNDDEKIKKKNNKCLKCDVKWQAYEKEWFCLSCKNTDEYKEGCNGFTVYV